MWALLLVALRGFRREVVNKGEWNETRRLL
jgi:hypothetical protein